MTRSLVEQAQQGGRDAYERLAESVAPRLFLVAQRILRDTDLAEDAVQQTLVDIWRDLPSLRDPDRFEAWAYRIVVHRCRAEARRMRRFTSRVIDNVETGTGADAFAAVAVRDQLERAFQELSHDHRVVVVLHHLAGLSLAEISEILDVPYGTVGSRLHHAMRAMRATLEAGDRLIIEGGAA